jgi:hypothetical protein
MTPAPYDDARTQGRGLARLHVNQGDNVIALRRDANTKLRNWERSGELGHGRGLSIAYWKAYIDELDMLVKEKAS